MPLSSSWESLPRTRRQRRSCSGSNSVELAMLPCRLKVVEIERGQVFQLLLFFFGQRMFQRLAGFVAADAPEFAQVLANVPFLLRAEAAEGPPEEYERPLELIVVQG